VSEIVTCLRFPETTRGLATEQLGTSTLPSHSGYLEVKSLLELGCHLSSHLIEGASGDAILWCDGNLYFYFPPPYFRLFYIPLLTQLYSFNKCSSSDVTHNGT